ncbi:hypothetical protein FRC11_002760 [Ceratobasidium sp. 423]|nr:hypothetical protein FRC11_002760 [Ceratobasidium sp. 423]
MHNTPSLSSIRATSAAQTHAALLLPSPPTTTSSGVTPGHAHLDTPPPGAEVVPLEQSQHTRKETRLGELWRPSAILDLLTYIRAKGPYKTRHTNLVWALEVVQHTWARDLPGVLPETPDLNALKLLAAHAAWLHGLVRDRLRQLVVFMYGLHCLPANEAQQWENEQIIARVLPNAFHCFDILQPRSRQYEHPILQHAIAVALFYLPDAIGAVYHMYFDPMPLPTVTFILTTIQFCLEEHLEWETGTFKAKELHADCQYNTYCVHLRGLQQYDTIANAHLMCFRQRWFQFVIASVVVPAQTQEVTNAANVCPDMLINTPESSPEL